MKNAERAPAFVSAGSAQALAELARLDTVGKAVLPTVVVPPGLDRATSDNAGLTLAESKRPSSSTGEDQSIDSDDAIVSPKAFISYSHEGEEIDGLWMARVRSFANLLIKHGVDVSFDQHDGHMNKDWNLWGPQLITTCDTVICLASPGFPKKWDAGRGSGLAAEARAIRLGYEEGQISLLFVVLPGQDASGLPSSMGSVHREIVKDITDEGIEMVLRELTNQHLHPKPPVGPVTRLPSAVDSSPKDLRVSRQGNVRWNSDFAHMRVVVTNDATRAAHRVLVRALIDGDVVATAVVSVVLQGQASEAVLAVPRRYFESADPERLRASVTLTFDAVADA